MTDHDRDQQLQAQGERAVANPPRAVGQQQARGPGYIDGQFSVVEPGVSTVGVSAGKPAEAEAKAEAPEAKAAKPKWGVGSLAAMGRLGLKELASYLPAFNNGHHIEHEPGLPGNLTPGEVASNKQESTVHGKAHDADQEPKRKGSVHGDYEHKPLPQMPGEQQNQARGRSR